MKIFALACLCFCSAVDAADVSLLRQVKALEQRFADAEKKKTPLDSPELDKLTRESLPLIEKVVAAELKTHDDLLLEDTCRLAVFTNEVEPTGFTASLLYPLLKARRSELYRALSHMDSLRTKKLRYFLKMREAEAVHGNG